MKAQKPLLTYLRYTGALFIGTIVSFALFFLFFFFDLPYGDALLYGWMVVVGAVGVLSAVLVCPRRSRHISSWSFTILGGAFYAYLWYNSLYVFATGFGHESATLPFLPWLLLGGGITSTYFTIKAKRRAQQDVGGNPIYAPGDER